MESRVIVHMKKTVELDFMPCAARGMLVLPCFLLNAVCCVL